MESCQVVILYNHELFANGIERLLREHGFNPMALDGRARGAIKRVRGLHPQVVLVEDDEEDRVFATKLSGIVKRDPNVGVIHINIESNRLSIYSSKQVLATRTQDLFDAIDNLSVVQDEDRRPPEPVPAL